MGLTKMNQKLKQRNTTFGKRVDLSIVNWKVTEALVFKAKDGKYVQKLHKELIRKKEVLDKDVSLGDGINLGTVHN